MTISDINTAVSTVSTTLNYPPLSMIFGGLAGVLVAGGIFILHFKTKRTHPVWRLLQLILAVLLALAGSLFTIFGIVHYAVSLPES